MLFCPVYIELQPRQSLVPGLAPVSIWHPLPFNFFIFRTEHPAKDANPACPEHLGGRASRVAPFVSRMLLRAKDLPSHLTLLESALPRPSPHNLFIIRTCTDHSDVWETKDLQAQEFIDNSFVINTYERPSEVRKTQDL
jgi:hypothetical protein